MANLIMPVLAIACAVKGSLLLRWGTRPDKILAECVVGRLCFFRPQLFLPQDTL